MNHPVAQAGQSVVDREAGNGKPRAAAFAEALGELRRLGPLAVHAGLVSLAFVLAYCLRFDFAIPESQVRRLGYTLPVLLAIRLPLFGWFHLYKGLWRYFSSRDLVAIVKAVALGSLAFLAAVLLVFGHGFPRSVFLLEGLLTLALVAGVRFTARVAWDRKRNGGRRGTKRALVVGAGDAGELLTRDLKRNPSLDYEVVGFIDDDVRKGGRQIHGLEVLGTVDSLEELCREHEVDELLVAIPGATLEEHKRIFERCRSSGLPFKSVPALKELLFGEARISQLQEVGPEHLLGRESVQLDEASIRAEIAGKRVLITGAAGSIGSELARQVVVFGPEQLVLLDRSESDLYFLELELQEEFPEIDVCAVVGDVQDAAKVEAVLAEHSPQLLYHAAAYKHVPMMEKYPLDAIANNTFGTETMARTALEHGVEKFVLVSTDKAVRPVGVMGMTKRVAENVLLALADGSTTFVAVRFGNVLGSDGSVLPLFKRQIAEGGPVTVTDPEATRYFMLISEAAQLVLQAGAIGEDGQVFFLDMGEPIRVIDLAENLIKYSGLSPGSDVPMRVIGLRPGERLSEELVRDDEELVPTSHEKVLMVRNGRFDREEFERGLDRLHRLVADRDSAGAMEELRRMAGNT